MQFLCPVALPQLDPSMDTFLPQVAFIRPKGSCLLRARVPRFQSRFRLEVYRNNE